MLFDLSFFFFNDTATTEIYTLSLHDALPISTGDLAAIATKYSPIELEAHMLYPGSREATAHATAVVTLPSGEQIKGDRKSTRLNSSHGYISYAVFCLKKKKQKRTTTYQAIVHKVYHVI